MGTMNYIMYGISFGFCLIGGTMLGVGIWMAVDSDAKEAFAVAGVNEDLFWTSVYFMIIIGSLVFLVSFLGFFAATKANKGALFAFIGVVTFILILELILIIITGIFWDSLDAGTQEQMQDDVQTKYINEYANDTVSVNWNNMQIDWKCCGSRDYKDYVGSYYQLHEMQPVPWTCCVMFEGGRTLDQVVSVTTCREHALESELLQRSDYLHTRGCYSRLNDFLSQNSIIMIALTVVFVAVEVGGIVVAVLLLRD